MNTKLINKIIVIISCFLIIFSLGYEVFAEGASGLIKDAYTGEGATNITSAENSANKIISTILSIIRTVAAAIAIVILIVIACKYILASAGDRADIKKYAFNYIIGALILFSASALIGIVRNAVDDALGSE